MAYREKDAIAPASELPTLGHVDVLNEGEYVDEKVGSLSSRDSLDDATDRDEVVLVKGEPVITTGRDVSRFLLDTRDDGDPALTFRSAVLGTVFAGLGAALCQIYLFKPIQVGVSTVFLLLLIYSVGTAWAAILPRATWVEGTRFARLAPILHFINPGDFHLKEHVVASLVASTAAGGSSAVMNFAVQRLPDTPTQQNLPTVSIFQGIKIKLN
ncbi:hypothetical protein PHLCEN_2v4872 [Hermanssonia centrifuga]|uniref:Uncharacterized protein n=1 Tax=Hermanssonia centrifuga TaxID=98765 RepID=A0A2R6PG34_9APHY|nr:hypothetical protein PHLCEN_2v4872 [Hermanssonia centrifuga]